MDQSTISPEIKVATIEAASQDPFLSRITNIERKISDHKLEIVFLEDELRQVKEERPNVSIKWRESIRWCLEVDSENWRYFLKNTSAVYKCIVYKHKVDLTADIKNKIAVTLSALYKEKIIGRIEYNGMHLYGLTKFFNDDLTDLKEEHKSGLDKLLL